MVSWDPVVYRRFGGLRGRPFLDLISRIDADDPRQVVDLGCGPGTMTALLAQRWPGTPILGVDSSPEMIDAALRDRATATDISFVLADLADWEPGPEVDVIVSNAALQWVPEHRELLAGWAEALPVDGWLAFQVPGNFTAPSHLLMRELAESPRWAARLSGVLRHDHPVDDPLDYARLLQANGLLADCWETTYLQVLTGDDPVLEWVRGTGLRPVLAALTPDEAAEFEAEYAAGLRQAYPATPAGTLFPFRRIFAVGHRGGTP